MSEVQIISFRPCKKSNRCAWQLSVGQQQRVEIIKALYRGSTLLILDKPTAVLTPQKVDELFVIMRQMVKDDKPGKSHILTFFQL